ncbi:MAG: hypothetical protein HY549_10725, partial [Elusimicrobia bacterium]|nr:hypothetical protein [Elusimicrobiota bacterium]
MGKRPLSRLAAFLAISGLAMLLWGDAYAVLKTVGATNANTGYAGQRNIVYVPGRGYWIFFKATNSDRVVWRYSSDGLSWKAKDDSGNWTTQADVFPFLSLAPDAAWYAPSVWYAPNLNRIYVVANDGNNDTNGGGSTADGAESDATGNKLFLRWGTPESDGSITWNSSILRQRMTVRIRTGGGSGGVECQRVTNNSNVTYDPLAQRSAMVAYSSAPGREYLVLAADVKGSAGFGMGAIAITNLTADATGYYGNSENPNVYSYCHATSANTAIDNTLDLVAAPTLVPVRDGAAANVLMGVRIDNVDVAPAGENTGAVVRLDYTSEDTTAEANEVALGNIAFALDSVDETEGYGMSAINEVDLSSAHIVMIDQNGDLVYRRRNDSASWVGPILIDGTGQHGAGLESVKDPAIGLAYKIRGDGVPYRDVYIAYVVTGSTQITYAACRSTFTALSECDPPKAFITGSGLNNPKLGFWAYPNEPMPIMWSDASNVYFDKIITSTFPAVAVNSYSSDTISGFPAYLFQPNYALTLTGINFQNLGGGSTPYFLILKDTVSYTVSSGVPIYKDVQTEIGVASTTFINDTTLKANILLSTYVAAGYTYNLRVVMPDGQEYPSKYDRHRGGSADVSTFTLTFPEPTISGVYDQDGGKVSAGAIYRNDGTLSLSRPISIVGTNFMNWNGINAVGQSVLVSTNTVGIKFLRSSDGLEDSNVSVASMTYNVFGGTRVVAFVQISTSASAERYRLMLTNPSSGTALSAASTFYVTVPTATINFPGPGASVGFSQVAGWVGFNNDGQTVISSANVRITHVTTGKVWNGSVMTTLGFNNEEDKWKLASLSPLTTAYTYAFDASNTSAVPDDGPYEFAARAQTQDGGIGNPYQSGFVSTVSVTLDRFDPSITLTQPVGGSTNSISRILLTFSDIGAGLTTTQILVQDLGVPVGGPISSSNTWLSFSTGGTLGVAGEQIWLSTQNGLGTPGMIFNPALVGSVNVEINNTSSIKLPQWQDGHKYRISAYAKDGAGHTVDQSTTGTSAYTTFIYDVSKPTTTLTTPANMSNSSGTALWLPAVSAIAGMHQDNVADSLDGQNVFVRVARLLDNSEPEVVERWLDPGANPPNFNNGALVEATAWKTVPVTLSSTGTPTAWSWSMAGVEFLDGRIYRVEVYAADGAGNSTGTASVPLFKKYFRPDTGAPDLVNIKISTGSETDNGALVFSTVSNVGLYLSSNPLNTIRLSLTDGAGSGIKTSSYSLSYFDGLSSFLWTGSSWSAAGSTMWIGAVSTTTPKYQVAISSGIEWRNSKRYTLDYLIQDMAGNDYDFSAITFVFDSSAPTLSNFNVSSGTTYGMTADGQSSDLPDVLNGIVRDEIFGSGFLTAGNNRVGVGVKRQSDGKWFTTDSPNWQDTRNDPLVPPTGNSWELTLGAENGNFWNGRSTETYYVYLWANDNVPSPFENVSDSQSLKFVFQWEVWAPSSTLIAPSTATNNVWYSSHSGYDLPSIVGTATDFPDSGVGKGHNVSCSGPAAQEWPAGGWPGGSPNVCAAQVEIRGMDGAHLNQCWNGSTFGACSDATFLNMSAGQVLGANYELATAGALWNALSHGGSYRLRLRAKDAARRYSDGVWTPNVEIPFNAANCDAGLPLDKYNTRCIKIDKQGPTSVITDPDHDTDVNSPASIAGTAIDPHSGLGATFVAICRDVNPSAGTGGPNFSDCLNSTASTGTFGNPVKFFQIYYAGSPITSQSWSLNTSAVSAWNPDDYYHAVVRSSDTKQNIEASGITAAADSNHIKFRVVAAGAVGRINTPSSLNATFPFYRPASLTTIAGTATGNTHFQLRLRETDTDRYWNGSAWLVSVSTWFPTNPPASIASPPNWTQAFAAASWRVNQNYTVELRVCNATESSCSGTLNTQTFVIDSSAPVNTVTVPATAYSSAGVMNSLLGSISEVTAPGQTGSLNNSSVYFRVFRLKDTPDRLWSYSASTFVVSAVDCVSTLDETCLPATALGGGLFRYTTSYFQDNRAFEDGLQYRVDLIAKDMAGNSDDAPSPVTTRWDVSQATAAAEIPAPVIHINTVGTLSGTARDYNPNSGDPGNVAPTGIGSIQISIQSQQGVTNGTCFDGNSFGGACPGWQNVTAFYEDPVDLGRSTWTYTDGDLETALGTGRYVLMTRVTDKANNVQSNFAGNNSSYTFIVDKTIPTTSITQPTVGGQPNPPNEPILTPAQAAALGIQGAASDPAGAGGVTAGLLLTPDQGLEVKLWYLQGNTSYYWTGSTFTASISSVPGFANTNWTLASVPDETQYGWPGDKVFYFEARVHDASKLANGNVSPSTGNPSAWTPTASMIIDGTPGVSSITVPANGSVINTLAQIEGTASAGLSGINPNKMELQLSTNPVTGPYWTGSSYTFTVTWVSATVTGNNWTYADLAGALQDHARYFVKTRVTDRAGNEESVPPTFNFTWDISGPNLAINMPSPPAGSPHSNAAGSSKQITLSSGTVSDPGPNAAGISEVWIAISSGSGANAMWWCHDSSLGCPSSGQFSQGPQLAVYWSTRVSVTSPWLYNNAALAGQFTNAAQYKVFVRARDAAGTWTGNIVNPGDSGEVVQTFIYDSQLAPGAIQAPGAAWHGASLTQLYGTARDLNNPNSGLEAVKIAVREVGTGWWNFTTNGGYNADPNSVGGDAFSTTTLVDQGAGLYRWEYNFPIARYTAGFSYQVVIRPKDRATNITDGAPGAGEGVTFLYDNQAPLTASTFPVNGNNLRTATLTPLAGTANDTTTGNSGGQSVQALLKLETLGVSWNGSNSGNFNVDWDTNSATNYLEWQTVTGTGTWSRAFPTLSSDSALDSRRYRLWVRATDNAGNTSFSPSQAQFNNNDNGGGVGSALAFIYDRSAPTSRVTYPPAYVAYPALQVQGTAQDEYEGLREPSLVLTMNLRYRRSNGEYWNFGGSTWTTSAAFSPTSWNSVISPWAFTGFNAASMEDGFQYTVNSQASDASGNSETGYSTYTFIVDKTTPVAQVTFPADSGFAGGAAVTIQGTADDRFEVLQNFGGGLCESNSCVGTRDYESGHASSGVAVAIRELFGPNNYWDGDGFDSGVPVWSTGVFVGISSGAWSYALPAGALTSPRQYEVSARARDRAGNQQVSVTTITFTYDTSDPVAYATAPVGQVGSLNTLYGTALDLPPGLMDVALVRIRQIDCADDDADCHHSPNQCWNGNAWTTDCSISLASGTIGAIISGSTRAWTMDTSGVAWDDKSTYTITVAGRDQANNTEAFHTDLTIYLEAPSASIALTQPGSPDDRRYRSNAAQVLTINGTGNNLRTTAGVRLKLQRLSAPTSYWYIPNGAWSNDASTYTALNPAAAPPQNWTTGFAVVPYNVNNASYSITVTPVNNAGLTGISVTRVFWIDDTVPLTGVTEPSGPSCGGANTCVNVLNQIAGTATDPNNPISPQISAGNVKFRVKRNSDGFYWDGGDFAGVQTQFSPPSVSGGPTFSFSSAPAGGFKLQDGRIYTVYVHAADSAGNDETSEPAMGQYTVLLDSTPPVGYIAQPPSAQVFMALSTVTGTSQDPDGVFGANKSDMSRVELQIKDHRNNFCWTSGSGGSWGVCNAASWLGQSISGGANSWGYYDSQLNGELSSGESYVITVRGVDRSTNTQSSFGVPNSSRTVYMDKNPPNSGIIQPAGGTAYRPSVLNGGSALNGTASDPELSLYSDGDALDSVQYVLWYLDQGTSYYYIAASTTNGTKFSSTTIESVSWRGVTEGTATWNVSFNTADWVSDKQYYLKSRARDRARVFDGSIVGNLASATTPQVNLVDFVVDNTAPSSRVTQPVQTGFIQNFNAGIAGTANSDLSQASTYYLRIWYEDGTDKIFWNSTGWNTGSPNAPVQLPVAVVGATGTVNWSYPAGISGQATPTITRPDNTVYGVAIQVRDRAGNLETPTSAQYILDGLGPTMSISTPMASASNYGTARPLTSFNGTASDSPAGVSVVELQIQDQSSTGQPYWNGISWVLDNSTWVVATSTNPWAWAAPTWTPNKAYKVSIRARDLAGNQGTGTDVFFKYDINRPTSAIAVPSLAFYPNGQPPTLSGSAFDWVVYSATEAKTGLTRVEMAITQTGTLPLQYWQGGGWAASENWRTVSTDTADPAAWTYPPSNPAGDIIPPWNHNTNYTIQTRAIDLTSNVESPVTERSFTYDARAATNTVTFPGDGQYVTGFTLSSGAATDDSSGVQTAQIAIRDPLGSFWEGNAFNSFGGSSWRSVTNLWTSSWTFTDSNLTANIAALSVPRTYNVYVRAVDVAGNQTRGSGSPAGNGSLMKIDFIKPVAIATVPAQGSAVSNRISPISGTADDQSLSATSGVGMSEVRLKAIQENSVGTLSYWNGSEWVGTDQGFNLPTTMVGSAQSIVEFKSQDASLPDSAFYNPSAVPTPILDGYRYRIVSRAVDLLGNTDVTYSTLTFIVDRSTPTAAFTLPALASIYISTNNFTISSGTFSDPVTGGNIPSGVVQVQLQIEDISAGVHSIPGGQPWWNGASWQVGETSTNSLVWTSTWSYINVPATSPNDFVRNQASPDGRQYMLRIVARDLAGNRGLFSPAENIATARLTFDGTAPKAYIVSPAGPDDGDVTTLATISGTALDPEINDSSSAIRSVAVSIQNDPTNSISDPNRGRYWNAGSNSWVGTQFWNSTTWDGANWTFNDSDLDANLLIGSRYIIISTATDKAGNVEVPEPILTQPGYRRKYFQPPPAASAIDFPVNNEYYNKITGLNGTANGSTSRIQIQLKRNDTGQCWGGAGFNWVNCSVDVDTATRIVFPSGGTWIYPPPGESLPPWISVNNTSFTFTETALNTASQPECPTPTCPPNPTGRTVVFHIDISSPISSITSPESGGFLSAGPTLTGYTGDFRAANCTVGASCNPSGIKNPGGVHISLQRSVDSFFWNQDQSTWTASVAYADSTATWVASGVDLTTGAWSFISSLSTLTWQNGMTYTLSVRGTDKALGLPSPGNVENLTSPINFIIDTLRPGITISTPTASGRQRSLGTFSGTASDTAPGQLRRVEVRVLREAGAVYAEPPPLNFTQPTGDLAWFTVNNTGGDWTSWFVSSAVPFVDGSTYSVIARSIDRAGNYSVPYATSTLFVYDAQPPITAVVVPANNGIISGLSEIRGTLVDQPTGNPGGIIEVGVRMKRLSDDNYWTGSAWSGSLATMRSGLAQVQIWPSSWNVVSVNVPTSNLNTGTSYYITAASTDSATPGGNQELFGHVLGSTFTYDVSVPTASIAYPADLSYSSSIAQVYGGSADNVGVSTIALSIRHVNSGNCYDAVNNSFTAGCPSWFAARGSVDSWNYPFPTQPWTPNGSYVLSSSATDVANLAQTAVVSSSFTYDVTVATSRITMAAFVNNTVANITGTARDDLSGVGGYEIAISSNTGGDAGSWLNGLGGQFTAAGPVYIATSTPVAFPNVGQGNWTRAIGGAMTLQDGKTYRVYGRSHDRAGNVRSNEDLGSFIYDTTLPTISISQPNQPFSSAPISIIGVAADTSPGSVTQVRIRISTQTQDWTGSAWTDTVPTWITINSGFSPWVYTSTPPWVSGTTYTIRAEAYDQANNQSTLQTYSFVFDTGEPSIAMSNPATSRSRILSEQGRGTASTPAPGALDRVEVRVRRITPTPSNYWNPSPPLGGVFDLPAGQAENAWFVPGSTETPAWSRWYISSAALLADMVSGGTYEINARAWNKAGKYSPTYSTRTTTYDTFAPETSVLFPQAGSGVIVSSLSMIVGTLVDFTNAAGPANISTGTVSRVWVQLRQFSDGEFWNGGDWVPSYTLRSENTEVNVYLTSWTLTSVPAFPAFLTSGASYYIASGGFDSADNGGNIEALGGAAARVSTFTFDNDAPDTAISYPIDLSFSSSVINIAGSSADDVLVSTVALSIRRVIGGGCYDPANNDFSGGCPGWFPARGTVGSWNYAFPTQPWAPDNSYVINSSATDVAGNIQSSVVSSSFTYDVTVPTAALTVSAYINSGVANITGNARDGVSGVGAFRLAVSSANGAVGSWLSGLGGQFNAANPVYITTTSPAAFPAVGQGNWTRAISGAMTLEDGKDYRVYARTTDRAGNVRDNQDIGFFTYDNTPPTISITQPNAPFSSAPISIMGIASDISPGVINQVRIRISTATQDWTGSAWTDTVPTWINVTGGFSPWVYTSTPTWVSGTTYTIRAEAYDTATNQSSLQTYSFVFDTGEPSIAMTNPATSRSRSMSEQARGTASTPASGVMDRVEVRVRRITPTPSNYWNPTPPPGGVFDLPAGQAENAWFVPGSTETPAWSRWYISSAALLAEMASGGTYEINARAWNRAGKYSIPYATRTTTFDSFAPETSLLFPQAGSGVIVSSLNIIVGTLVDFT